LFFKNLDVFILMAPGSPGAILKHTHHWLGAFSGWHPGLLNETALASVMKRILIPRVCFNMLGYSLVWSKAMVFEIMITGSNPVTSAKNTPL
jgi:hypothetical protein